MPQPSVGIIGKYEILEVLGEGGFGVVYQVRDPDTGRIVAIKVLNLDFLRGYSPEIETLTELARVHHPHIATIYDVFQSENHLYIVTQYLSGRTLAEMLKTEGPMPLERALLILEQLANALDYVHGLGIIHRDIKPSNIMVEKDLRGEVHVTLMDFDMMKPIKARDLTTARNIIVGTFNYMAPEQLTGEYLGPAIDIYALGTVAYEMLTGHVPFEDKSTVEILYAVPHEPPPDPKSIIEDIPGSVAQVLLKALSKAPEERYPTAMAMVDALREAQHGKGTVVHTPARRIDELIAALRNRDNSVRQVAAEALGKVKDSQAVKPLAAVLQDEDARVRRAAAEALGKIGAVQAVGPLITALSDNSTYVRRTTAKALGEIGNTEAVEPLITALRDERVSVRQAAAKALGKIGDVRAVEPLIAAQLHDATYIEHAFLRAYESEEINLDQVIESLVNTNKEWRVHALSEVAQALVQMGERAQARDVLTRALDAAEGIEVQWRKAEALSDIAQALAQVGNREDMGRALAVARAIEDKSYRTEVFRRITHALAQVGEIEQARIIENELIQSEVGKALADPEGTGAIAQGSRSVAAGEGSLAVTGDVRGSSIVTGPIYNYQTMSSVETFAVAQIEGHYEGNGLVVNKEYKLLVGILSSIPAEFVGVPVRLPDIDVVDIDVVVHTAGMEVLPNRVQKMRYFRGRDSGLIEFSLIPREAGQKRILVEFYYELHWLAQLTFEIDVVVSQELVLA